MKKIAILLFSIVIFYFYSAVSACELKDKESFVGCNLGAAPFTAYVEVANIQTKYVSDVDNDYNEYEVSATVIENLIGKLPNIICIRIVTEGVRVPPHVNVGDKYLASLWILSSRGSCKYMDEFGSINEVSSSELTYWRHEASEIKKRKKAKLEKKKLISS